MGEKNIFEKCQTCPDNVDLNSIIKRDNLVDLVEQILDTEQTCVILEGKQGVGKSYFSYEFASKNNHKCVSIFIRNIDKWGYDLELLKRDIFSQVHYYTSNECCEEEPEYDDVLYIRTLYKLNKTLNKSNENFYFIIDGFDKIPEKEFEIKYKIIEALPLSYQKVRFIFTVDSASEKIDKYLNGLSPKYIPISGFSFEETKKLFEDMDITLEQLQDIHKLASALPERLSIIKRAILKVGSVEEFFTNKTSDFFQILDKEWETISQDEFYKKVLAVLVHETSLCTINQIAAILKVTENIVEDAVENIEFVNVEKDSGKVEFINDSYKKFCTEKLTEYDNCINNLIADYLFQDQKSEDSIKYLPNYLEKSGRYKDLVDYLSPKNFMILLEKSQSISTLENKVDIGISVANKSGNNDEKIGMGIYKSILLEFEKNYILKSEIKAYIALNDINGAINLAQAAITKEQRLHLLAIIGKYQKSKDGISDNSIIEQIRILYNEIDYIIKPEKAIEIASDLIFCCPDLAIDLIENRRENNNINEENDLDLIFAQFSLSTMNSKDKENNFFNEVNSRIKNDELRTLPNKLALLVDNYSAEQILQEVSKFKTTTEKLFFLTKWTEINSEGEGTYKVIDYALNLMISTTAYAPNAKKYRELASPLPYIEDENNLRKLVFIFENQKDTIEKIGPTEEYVRLQIILIKAIIKYDVETAIYKCIEIKDYINKIEDLSIKTFCIANLLDSLMEINDIDEVKELELYSETQTEFNKLFEELLLTSADQYETSINIMTTLSKNNFDMSLQLIKLINTEERRDRALYKVLSEVLNKKLEEIDISLLMQKITEIVHTQLKHNIIIKVLERLDSEKKAIDEAIDISFRFTKLINDIDDLEDKCYALCLWYLILNKKDVCDGKCDKILQTLEESWNSIDLIWNKVNIGYTIVSKVAKINIELGEEFFNNTVELKKEYKFVSYEISALLIRNIQLCIRAFSGLLKRKLNKESDIDRIKDVINLIPSYGEKAILWSDMALRCHKEKEMNLFHRIVSEHIRPCIDNLDKKDKQYKDDLIFRLAPTLFHSSSTRALSEIAKLSELKRNEAYYRIVKYIFAKHTDSDPYDNCGKDEYKITNDDIVNSITILNESTNEDLIYYIVSGICTSVYRKKAQVTQDQRNEITHQLLKIIDEKLPDIKNIKHDGYKIICKAQVGRINKSNYNFRDLINETNNNIDNLSDRAYILSILATLAPTKESVLQSQLLNDAKQIIDKLPSIYDRIDLYQNISSEAWVINSGIARKCMMEAMNIAIMRNDRKCAKAQRRIIDLAYRLDPELASSLVSLADDDSVRSEIKENIKKEANLNNTKKSMESRKTENKDEENQKNDYSRAAWRVLAGLNAGRQPSIKFDESIKYIEKVSELPFRDSYRILAWIIQNNVIKYSNSDHAEMYIRIYLEKLLLGIDLCVQMGNKAAGSIYKKENIIQVEDKSSVIIKPGDREKAIDYLKKWIEENIEDIILISDPFFGAEELELIKLISEIRPDIQIKVLTSFKHQETYMPKGEEIEEYFENYWKQNISDIEPPECEIVLVAGKKTNEPPIHDRWLISVKDGIRLGTSYNSLGITKISEISHFTCEEIIERKELVEEYLNREAKVFNGEKLKYKLFTL